MAPKRDICNCNPRRRKNVKAHCDPVSRRGLKNHDLQRLRPPSKTITISDLVYKFLGDVACVSVEKRQRNNARSNFKRAHVRRSRRQHRRPDAPERRLDAAVQQKRQTKNVNHSHPKSELRGPQPSLRSDSRDTINIQGQEARRARKPRPKTDRIKNKKMSKNEAVTRPPKNNNDYNCDCICHSTKKRSRSSMSNSSSRMELVDAPEMKRHKLTLKEMDEDTRNNSDNDPDEGETTTKDDDVKSEEKLDRTSSASRSATGSDVEQPLPVAATQQTSVSRKPSRKESNVVETRSSCDEIDQTNDANQDEDHENGNDNVEEDPSEGNGSEDDHSEDNPSEDNNGENRES